jgi:hypothetical protein
VLVLATDARIICDAAYGGKIDAHTQITLIKNASILSVKSWYAHPSTSKKIRESVAKKK